jgi:hypothetical protein
LLGGGLGLDVFLCGHRRFYFLVNDS